MLVAPLSDADLDLDLGGGVGQSELVLHRPRHVWGGLAVEYQLQPFLVHGLLHQFDGGVGGVVGHACAVALGIEVVHHPRAEASQKFEGVHLEGHFGSFCSSLV